MKTVSMPDLTARFAIAVGLPPLDMLAYQIHMPSPSNGEPCGVVAGSGVLMGGGMLGVGRRAAPAGEARALGAAGAAPGGAARSRARRRRGFAAGSAAATWRSTGFAA